MKTIFKFKKPIKNGKEKVKLITYEFEDTIKDYIRKMEDSDMSIRKIDLEITFGTSDDKRWKYFKKTKIDYKKQIIYYKEIQQVILKSMKKCTHKKILRCREYVSMDSYAFTIRCKKCNKLLVSGWSAEETDKLWEEYNK